MSLFIVDASVIGPFFFDDETDRLVPNLTDLISEGECLVPQHWWLEIANQLLSGLKRGRSEFEIAAWLLQEVQSLPIATDQKTGEQFRIIFDLAAKHGLTVYDAAYLELAKRSEATLVSYDTALRMAAVAESIEILPAP